MTDDFKANESSLLTQTTTPRDASELISKKLRELYDGVCEQGVSDRFLDLLERLDEAEKKSGSGGNS